MSVLDPIAREAGRAIAECGGKESSPLVAEVAAVLVELAAEPPSRRSRKRQTPNSKFQKSATKDDR